jgi:hypothetical protein
LGANDVAGQDLGQLILGFRRQKAFDGARGQFFKGGVGGSEDREGARTGQRFNKASGLHGGDER